MTATLRQALVAGCLLIAGASFGAVAAPVAPLPLPGPHPVACSNVTQDFTRLGPGEDVQLYWEGVARAPGVPRDPSDLLSDPANTLAVTVNAPANVNLFGALAGRALRYVVIACHPTAAADPRPDYALPTGRKVPRMQRGGEAPLWPDATTRYPALLFSHGLGGSPLSNDYIAVLTTLASYGYVVAAPFHTDAKVTDIKLRDFGDVLYMLTHFEEAVSMQAIRPLALTATLDLLLAHPHWRERVDSAQVGGFGASLGGESLLLMGGAGLTTSIGQSWTRITRDPRLKAAVGYVPYFGQSILPAFGRDQQGLDGVTLPYLAISGTADTTAPIAQALQGVARLDGPRELVALTGVEHGFDVLSTADIFTWSVAFLEAEMRGSQAARARLLDLTSVAGGGDDRVLIAYSNPSPLNFGGLWWSSPADSEAGWGINIAHQADTLFATWFTYDTSRRGWWLVMTGQKTAEGVYTGTLYETRGPAFNAAPFNPAGVTPTAVGSGTLTFADASNATFAYTVNGLSQTKILTREVFGPLPTCTFGGQPDLALATNYQDLWWNAPAGSESGWGINLTHQGDTIFATWFTYDLDGRPLWLVATAGKTGPGRYAGDLYRTAGARFDAFSTADVNATNVGSATLTFASGNSATFGYSVQLAGMSSPVFATKAITREVFALPGTACH